MQPYTHLETLETLTRHDFKVWYHSFREVIEQKIPHFENLLFINADDDFAAYFHSPKLINRLEKYFNKEQGGKDLFLSIDSTVFFSVPAMNERVVVVITGMDSYFANRVSMDWLRDLSTQVTELFLLIKKGGSDLETGLPNNTHFYSTLKNLNSHASLSLILIELFPKARSAMDAQMHKAKAVRSLKSCLGNTPSLYYLGHHVYALLLPSIEKSGCRTIAKRTFSWLRRDGFRKIHIGLRWGGIFQADTDRNDHRIIFEQVSYALQVARRRGPFSLCDYSHLSHPEEHPLRKPSKALLAKFQRKWRASNSFTVIEMKPAVDNDIQVIQSALPKKYLISGDDGLYLFFENKKPEEALTLTGKLLQELEIGDIQRGVAYYPHLSFGKSAIIFNCRKALCHAAFFGANASAVFDGVSLNVSGDIYYAEGDLTSAVKEYKTGIWCDPDNVNLLNSLGVAYADMDRHKAARKCFEKVLSLDSENFMALYNSGLEAELTGRTAEALDFFEQAFSLHQEDRDEDIETDLQYRLGRLCALEGRHQRAVEMLLPWYTSSAQNATKERALPYIGLAYYGLREYREAIMWLQKALQYNEFDAESMGLLGLCYLLQNEGNDIALSLCEKSVEFAPDNSILQIYLARAQIACNLHENARITLKKCLRQKLTRQEAQLLSCVNFKEQGKLKRARYWLAKLSAYELQDKDIAKQCQQLHEELNEI
jgi:tetratricopeptide (TPR) repeat protein